MSQRNFKLSALAVALLSCAALSAHAATLNVNLAGWVATDDFGSEDNSTVMLNLPVGATVTGFSYSNLVFATVPTDFSWLSDLTLSVNQLLAGGTSIGEWFDWKPSAVDAPGTAGPLSGSWGGATGLAGPYGAGSSFVMGAGQALYITVYLDAYFPSDGITIRSGTLSINYTPLPVPEPASYGLLALGLVAVGARVKRRSA